MSSRPGQTRFARCSYRASRASRRSGGSSAASPPGRWRMLRPSKLPASLTPQWARIASASRPASPASGQHLAHLVGRPDVEAALLALGVRVERRVEAALGAAHLPQRPVERRLAHFAPALVAERPASRAGRRAPGARCRRASSRSGGPARLRPRSSARSRRRSGLDAACRHRVERDLDHVVHASREQELEHRGRRELRRAAEAAVAHVGRASRSAARHGRAMSGESGSSEGSTRLRAPSCSRIWPAAAVNALALGRPRFDHRLHHHPEARHSLARLRREVGAAVERHALGVAEHGQRPAAVTGHRLDRLHVDVVDVGPLLPVDLDGHEVARS